MGGLVRTAAAVLLGTALALFVPRFAGEEYHFHARRRIAPQNTSSDTQSAEAVQPIVVADATWFALIDGSTGEALRIGRRSPTFTATTEGLVNQASDSPRWAVQSWGGDVHRIVENRGAPVIDGPFLFQFDGEGRVIASDLFGTGAEGPWESSALSHTTVYAVAHGETSSWIARGSLTGALRFEEVGSNRRYDTVFTFERYAESVPTVYAVAARPAETGGGRPPPDAAAPAPSYDVAVIQGLNPQQLRILRTSGDGELNERASIAIPPEFAVRRPVSFAFDEAGDAVAALAGALVIVDVDEGEARIVADRGTLAVDHVLSTPVGSRLVVGRYRGGVRLSIVDDEYRRMVMWEIPSAGPAVVHGTPPVGGVMVAREGIFTAVEIGR